MNLTGYDQENGAAYHPVRERLRRDLAQTMPAEVVAEFRDFQAERPEHHFWVFIQYVLSTGGAPSFEPLGFDELCAEGKEESAYRPMVEELRGLEGIIRKAWAVPDVQSAYRDAEDQVMAHGSEYAAAFRTGYEKAVEYLKADPTNLKLDYIFVPNLLQSYFEATGHRVGHKFYDVEGPQSEHPREARPGDVGNPHEFVHGLISSVTKDLARIELFAPKVQEIFDTSMAYGHYYDMLPAFVDVS